MQIFFDVLLMTIEEKLQKKTATTITTVLYARAFMDTHTHSYKEDNTRINLDYAVWGVLTKDRKRTKVKDPEKKNAQRQQQKL